MRLSALVSRSRLGRRPGPVIIPEAPEESWVRPGRAHALVEMLVLFLALLAIDRLVLDGSAFAALNPNPYWLPVIAMAVGYGSGIGLVAAFVAGVIWLVAPHPAGTGDHLDAMLRLSLQPMLWVAVALAIGELTAGRLDRAERLRRHTQRHEEERAVLTEAVEHLARTNRALQVRIAVEDRTVGEAVAAAADLVALDAPRRMAGIARLVALAARTEDFVFYTAAGHAFAARLRGREAAGRPDALSWEALAEAISASRQQIGPANAAGATPIPVFGNDEAVVGLLMVHAAAEPLTLAKRAELAGIVGALGRLLCSAEPDRATPPAPFEAFLLRGGVA